MRAHLSFVLFALVSGCGAGGVSETDNWLTTKYSSMTARSQTTSQGIHSELSLADGSRVATLDVRGDGATMQASGATRAVTGAAHASLPADNLTANDWLYLASNTAAKQVPATAAARSSTAQPQLAEVDAAIDCGSFGSCSTCCDSKNCCSCCGDCGTISCAPR